MMHERGKSDSAIGAVKPANKAARSAAELVEQRAGTKGNADQQSTRRVQDRESVSQALGRIRQAAKQRKKEVFTSLLHHISIDLLRLSFFAIKKDAASGVDGLTWQDYGADLERKLGDLHDRVHRGAYRALPSRRQYIPKPDGRQRPIAIAALEDKIVQRATVAVLSAIYEEDFLGFSYGFRPKRSQHDALDALVVGITSKKVNYILDADIRGFFDEVNRSWLTRFLEHRIGDPRILRLIQKWLKAGILEEGIVTNSEKGTPQGSVASPLLANVYLHYAFDLWAQRWRRREATGDMIIVRYADDIVVGFEHESDARRFWDAMRERLQEFSLSLHPEKTRLIEFGRFAAANRRRRGLGKPDSFKFLGFSFICGKSLRGNFLLKRRSRRDRMKAKIKEVAGELRQRMHQSIPEQGTWLKQVITGYFAYHAVPTNWAALGAFRDEITKRWQWTLQRRSQKGSRTWEQMKKLADDWLPKPRILHPWPNQRFAVKHPR
ncbi:MAG: group II intron reverse transcriptase/maturase [Alphaproteobacteria bacterium]|nr:group II intron reverse transcriptase/maturase [Alphaproteobacteria bacterium]